MSKKEENNIEIRSEEFQDILGDTPPEILRWGVLIFTFVVLIILVGSAIFKYPDTINSTMTLTGKNPPAVIIARSSGKLVALNVKDNQIVNAGEYLAVIDNSANIKDVLKLKKYLTDINSKLNIIIKLPPKEMQLGDINTTYSSFYITLSEYFQFIQHHYYLSKRLLMEDRIKRNETHYKNNLKQKKIIQEQLLLTRNQYMRDSTLNSRGALSNEELEKTKNQCLQGYLSLENMLSNLESMKMQTVQLNEDLLDVENQYLEKKNKLETQIKSYTNQLLAEIQTWEMNYVLRAPFAGKISFTTYWSVNQNITSGNEIFNVLPINKGEIIGKANLPSIRSGKVKAGLAVNIKFENFPDNEFGIVRGKVQSMSLIPSKGENGNYYVIEIKLLEGLRTTYNKDLPYLPEMKAQAEIVTEDMSLLERLLMPIKKVVKENI